MRKPVENRTREKLEGGKMEGLEESLGEARLGEPAGIGSNHDAGEHNLAEGPERSRALFNAGPEDGSFVRIDQERS